MWEFSDVESKATINSSEDNSSMKIVGQSVTSHSVSRSFSHLVTHSHIHSVN